jgi:hypothetical protein
MSSQINFVEVPKELHPILGTPAKGSRTYKRKGTQEEVGHWYDVLNKTVGPTVSTGGVRMFVPVTRAAIHERIDRGRLSMFEFDVVKRVTNLFGTSKEVQERPYTYVPVSECQQWRAEIEERAKARGISAEEIARAKPGWLDDFLDSVKEEDDSAKKSLPAKLEISLTEYEREQLTFLAESLKLDGASEIASKILQRIIAGGFSGISFIKASWWMVNQLEEHNVGEFPLPKALDKIRRRTR